MNVQFPILIEIHKSNSDPGDVSLQLLKYAKGIVRVKDKTKDRISDNQPTIEDYVKDKPKDKDKASKR